MTTFNGFPDQVYNAALTGSNGVKITGSLSPNKIIVSLNDPITVSGSNVGIGTATPHCALDVNGTTCANSLLSGYTNSNLGIIRLAQGASKNQIQSGLNASNGSNHPLVFSGYQSANITGSEWMRIETNGNVGIGTTNPEAKLHLWNNLSNLSDSFIKFTSDIGDGQIPVEFQIDNTIRGRIRCDYAGNMFYVTNGSGAPDGCHTFYTGGDFGTGSVKMILTDDGKLGIGTTSPSQKLSVNGNISADGIVFGSTGGAVTSKTLEDYEEGTFTPTLDTTFATSPSYGSRYGYYIKTGRMVQFWYRMTVDSCISNTGQLLINGLPFVCSTVTGSCTVDFLTGFTTGFTGSVTGHVFNGFSGFSFFKTSNGTSSVITTSDTTTDFAIYGNGVYYSNT